MKEFSVQKRTKLVAVKTDEGYDVYDFDKLVSQNATLTNENDVEEFCKNYQMMTDITNRMDNWKSSLIK